MKTWILVGLVWGLCNLSIWAQDDDEPMGGINTPSGLTDLRTSQQKGPFADFPWDVQSLLEKHVNILQKTPEPVYSYLLNRAMDWDVLFDVERQRIIQFFKQAKSLSADEMKVAFQNVSSQEHAIEWAIDQWMMDTQKPAPALVVLVVNSSEANAFAEAIPDGISISDLKFDDGWLDAFLIPESQDPLTVLGRVRQQRNPKNPYSAIVVADTLPSVMAGKQKGDAKKYAPLFVGTEDLTPAVMLSQELLQKEAGKSEAYLEIVRSKWTPESLKMPKQYRQKDLGALVMRAINKPDGAKLDASFKQHLALNLVWRAQPDAMLVMLSDANRIEVQRFVGMLVTSLNSRFRYADNSLLVVVDEGQKEVVLWGQSANGVEIQKLTGFADLSQKLMQNLGMNTPVQ